MKLFVYDKQYPFQHRDFAHSISRLVCYIRILRPGSRGELANASYIYIYILFNCFISFFCLFFSGFPYTTYRLYYTILYYIIL